MVMRTGIVFEIEDTLFDMHAMRVEALHRAMAAEGLPAERDAVSRAHRGVPAGLALHRLADGCRMDDTASELILLRTNDELRTSLDLQLPSFDVRVRDAMLTLASDFPLAVVTRATRDLAQQLLSVCDLDAVVSTIKSISDVPAPVFVEDGAGQWAAAAAALHADRCVAIARVEMLEAARRAGLRTVAVTGVAFAADPDAHHADAMVVSFAEVNASFILALP